ncbi:MAG TPA: D-glycerate dehydrogenase [Bacillales bacterium]|nr:D-glycerate dehydrogenase [Bacillales bacterium]
MDSVLVYHPIPDFLLEKLQHHCKMSYFEQLNDENQDEFKRELKKADALLGAGLPITNDLLDSAPQLRYVGNISAGYDNFHLDEMTKHGVMAVNAPKALTDTTADLIFGSLVSAARRITELDRYVRGGEWREPVGKELFGLNVHHKTIGIVGLGRIGKAVAKRAAFGFDMKVLYNKRNRDTVAEKTFGAEFCNLPELLENADFVCLTLPLTDQTYHIIDEQALSRMKPTSVLINGGRGPLVDEKALVKALQNQKIAGAGLDVFEEEPLSDENPLMDFNQVVLTPHIGSATEETRNGMAAEAVDNLLQAMQGNRPDNLLNPEVMKTYED